MLVPYGARPPSLCDLATWTTAAWSGDLMVLRTSKFSEAEKIESAIRTVSTPN